MAFSLENKHIIVKYHYIENPREDRRAFYPCTVDEFERQVIFLKNNFKITTVDDVFGAAQREIPEKMCALTFDDGLKDNFENVVPILKKHGIIGTFFPITKTFEEFLPATHKMHIALSLQDADKLVDRFNAFLSVSFPKMVKKILIDKSVRLTTARKMYDDIAIANLKETMNLIPRNIRDTFLDIVFKENLLDEKEIARSLFMSLREIKLLKEVGHIVGSHCHSHEALDTMNESCARKEVKISKEILEKMLGTGITLLAYPQSAPHGNIRSVLEESGFRFALTTEARGISLGEDPYFIPRYDTNHIRDFLNSNGEQKNLIEL